MPSRRRRVFGRILEYSIAIALVAILVYVTLFVVRIAEGVRRTSGAPSQVVRLQILNGCGVTGLSADMFPRLDGFSDAAVEVRVVDTGTFDLRTVKKSFVISRVEDLAAARTLAGKLGLNPEEVVFQPLGHNVRHVSATLVVGQDYPSIRSLNAL